MNERLNLIKIAMTEKILKLPKNFKLYGKNVKSRLYVTNIKAETQQTIIRNNTYNRDDYSNVTPKIISYLGRNLHTKKHHPLSLVREKIVNYFYKTFVNNRGNPVFSVYDNLSPIVTVDQNFDSLLIPKDHVSRLKSDCYYINRDYLLRAHTTAHQQELLRSGLNNFLIIGDVYRRDEIDSTHFPVFHQADAVRTKTRNQLFPADDFLQIFESGNTVRSIGSQNIQACHTLEAVKLMEYELKTTLVGLARELFGKDMRHKWTDTFFPFTQPSWELEVYHDNKWLEILGCGIMKQPILTNAGIKDQIGWAFGIGLERVAMCLYNIPDIRLFWSNDSGFLNQFVTKDANEKITYKPVSQYPQCANDISFWLPETYSRNDFYDLVRSVGGDVVEQVLFIDEFVHQKSNRTSHCYRIVYRHMEKTLTQNEVNEIHNRIGSVASEQLKITLR